MAEPKRRSIKYGGILDEVGDDALRRFLADCRSVVEFDEERAYTLAKAALKYYSGDKTVREQLRHLQDIETRWYASLTTGIPDYTVYDDPYILSDIWSCWIIYSRKYVLSLRSKDSLSTGVSLREYFGRVNSVVDVGCGFGYTTAALKATFPNAAVFGTQLPLSAQFQVATMNGEKYGFTIVSDVTKVTAIPVNVVFASEYFEHIEDPVAHLNHIVRTVSPRFFVIANAFNTMSVGHFRCYRVRNQPVPEAQISKVFNNQLRGLGYTKLKTKLWNNRPSVWERTGMAKIQLFDAV